MADSITSANSIPASNSPSPSLNGTMSKASNGDQSNNAVSKSEPQAKISDMAQTARVELLESVDSLRKLTEELSEAIAALNAALGKAPTKAIITHDDALNRYIVRIADKASGEVVREIPSEAILKFARNLQEIKGLMFDERL